MRGGICVSVLCLSVRARVCVCVSVCMSVRRGWHAQDHHDRSLGKGRSFFLPMDPFPILSFLPKRTSR